MPPHTHDPATLKRTLDLPALLRAQGHALHAHGKGLSAHCPYHAGDDTPSLILNRLEDGTWLWHCMACGRGGDVFNWIAMKENLTLPKDFPKALKWLKHWLGVDTSRKQQSSATEVTTSPTSIKSGSADIPSQTQQTSASQAFTIDQQNLLNEVATLYHKNLLKEEEGLQARKYLQKRGIYNAEAIALFKLGYSNRTLCTIAPQGVSRHKQTRNLLTEIGLIRDSGHEHLSGSVIIPLFDEKGNVVQMYGRKLSNSQSEGISKHLYLKGAQRGIFNREALKAESIIICEALIDALSWWVNGYKNVTSTFGVQGFTEEMFEALRKRHPERAYFSFDADEAGDTMAIKHASRLMEIGIECFRIRFPGGMDANEFIRKYNPAKEALAQLIANADRMGTPAHPQQTSASSATPSPTSIKPGLAGSPSQTQETSASTAYPSLNDSLNESLNESFSLNENESIKEEKNNLTASTTSLSSAQTEDKRTIAKSNVQAESAVSFSSLNESLNDSAIKEGKIISLESAKQALESNIEMKGEDIYMVIGSRRYRIRSLFKNNSLETMRVNLMVQKCENGHYNGKVFIDTVDLYSQKSRKGFVLEGAEELGLEEIVIKNDLGKILFECEAVQQKKFFSLKDEKVYKMSKEEEEEAIAFLKRKDLVSEIERHFEICGIIGERINLKVMYFAGLSRMLPKPLHIMLQGLSGAGKSAMLELILKMIPEEAKVIFTAMTGQSLYYMGGEIDLKHKTLAITEKEGLERAKYAVKNLQSDGKVSIASTDRDPKSGRLEARSYNTDGPVQMMSSTTDVDYDEEMQNRNLILGVDISRDQTKAIHQIQREMETMDGYKKEIEKEKIIKLHQNAQRLIKPLKVFNPYAPDLTFIDTLHRTRRDNLKYLTLINAIALLHQYQRPIKKMIEKGKEVEYISATIEDIELANELCNEVLGQSLNDLAPHSKKILEMIYEMVQKDCEKQGIEQAHYRFTRRKIREALYFSDSQLKTHLPRLVELEYMIRYGSQNKGSLEQYELLYKGEGRDGNKFMLGLIDVKKLKKV